MDLRKVTVEILQFDLCKENVNNLYLKNLEVEELFKEEATSNVPTWLSDRLMMYSEDNSN